MIAKNLKYNLLLCIVKKFVVLLRGVVAQALRLVFVGRSLGWGARMGNTLYI